MSGKRIRQEHDAHPNEEKHPSSSDGNLGLGFAERTSLEVGFWLRKTFVRLVDLTLDLC